MSDENLPIQINPDESGIPNQIIVEKSECQDGEELSKDAESTAAESTSAEAKASVENTVSTENAAPNLTSTENEGTEPPAKKAKKLDGSLDKVNPAVLEASKDVEIWIAERRKNWPTKQRIAERKEQAVKDAEAGIANKPASTPAGPQKPAARPCRYFARGKCRAGDSCRFSHASPGEGPRPVEQGSRVYKRFEAPVRSSLFVKLVQSDHDAEDLRVLSVINDLYKQGCLN